MAQAAKERGRDKSVPTAPRAVGTDLSRPRSFAAYVLSIPGYAPVGILNSQAYKLIGAAIHRILATRLLQRSSQIDHDTGC